MLKKSIKLKLNMPTETAEQKLKDTTYPYCKNLTNNYDFIGSVFNDKVNITINTTGPREIFKTTVNGYFYENENNTIFQATLKVSSITKRFIGFINVIMLIIFVCFLIFAISKFFVPIALIILINLFSLFFIRINFNITNQIICKIFNVRQ